MGEFGLIGRTLGHSFSPEVHALLGGGYPYRLIELEPEAVAPFLDSGSFDGLNVTIPYKRTALALCDALSDEARRIGSVNTIVNKDGKLCGYVTDGMDVVDAICEAAQPTDDNGTISAEDQPVITSITILTDQ